MSENQIKETKDSQKQPFKDIAWPLRILVGGLFSLIVLFTLSQIVFRFVFNAPLIWSEELSRFLLVWMTFVGAAVVVWDGRHLCVDVFYNMFTPKWRSFIRYFNGALIMVFLGYGLYQGWIIIRLEQYTDIGSLNIVASWYRMPFFVGGGLIILGVLARFFYRLPRKQDKSPL